MDRSDGIGARDSAAGQVRGRAETTTARGVGWRDPAISWSNGTPMRMPLRRAWSAPRRARSTLASFFSFFSGSLSLAIGVLSAEPDRAGGLPGMQGKYGATTDTSTVLL
jgi:hypothetical protein